LSRHFRALLAMRRGFGPERRRCDDCGVPNPAIISAAMSAVAFKTPIPGMVTSRRAVASLRAAATNSASRPRSADQVCPPHVVDQQADARA